ncbi:hypothetical protein LG634_33005 [Streptomyces bambusae]|uniref:sensor histidine kinase n=1 Tax=Streptomyces bambusae TaxID=1550616 RepID=UPI001CFF94A8|nr:hypothetical protein [Streptomyces bambusae]MCB5169613.1 hypothetical protein [Streptomyces bambusae]
MSSTTAPVVGSRFAEALNEGLLRAAVRMRPPAAQRTAPPPRLSGAPASRPAGPGPAGPAAPAAALGSWESAAVLERFAARLPEVLAPAEAGVPAVRTALVDFARAVLARAAAPGDASAPAPPAPPAASPHQVVTAAALLLECAVLHVLENGIAHRETGLLRAVAVVQGLGAAVRGLGDPVWTGDDGWNERRRLARQLSDELGGALSLARLSLARVTRETAGPDDRAVHLAAAERALADAAQENEALIGGLRRRCDLPPLREALEEFLAGPGPQGDRAVVASVEVAGDEGLIPERHRREIYLALREALRDRLARPDTGHVSVVVRITRRWLYARVTDDGTGPGEAGGDALRSLTERIEDLGGRAETSAGEVAGTVVEIHLPVRPRS